MGTPSTANIIQTMKHTVKAIVLEVRTVYDWVEAADMAASPKKQGICGGRESSACRGRFQFTQPEVF
jgi:hypothetical protein